MDSIRNLLKTHLGKLAKVSIGRDPGLDRLAEVKIEEITL